MSAFSHNTRRANIIARPRRAPSLDRRTAPRRRRALANLAATNNSRPVGLTSGAADFLSSTWAPGPGSRELPEITTAARAREQ